MAELSSTASGQITRAMKQRINRFQKRFNQKFDFWATKLFPLIIKPFSRFFRRVFEFTKIKQAVGLFLVVSVLGMAIFPVSLSTAQANIEITKTQIGAESAPLVTEQSVRLPIDSFKVTQGFSFFHPGVDLAATKGAPIYAIMEGYVEEIQKDRWGYGNHVYINHGNGLKSLYAHLAQIEVKENEFVNKDSIIGLVGSTGWSSGPHLHLQIWEGEKLINPRTFLETYLGQKLASVK